MLLGLFGSLFCTLLVWTLAMMAPSNMLKADAQHRQECGALSDLSAGPRRGRAGGGRFRARRPAPTSLEEALDTLWGPTELPVESCPWRTAT